MGRRGRQPKVRREVQELSLLFEISQTLDGSMDLRDVVAPVLRAMAKHMEMLRGTLTLLNRETGEIFIETAYGLSASQQGRGRYKLGEGVTGKVVQTGQPAVVPRISEEPLFLNRTGARKRLRKEDISFTCVPIKLGNEVIGALSADRLFAAEVSLEEEVRLLSIIASMIAQAVRLRRAAQEERQRLLEENTRLQEELKDRFRPSNIIGNSSAMQAVYDMIGQVSKSNTTALIRGESGVGKELVAQAIHYNSLRANGPFIKVSCGALPENLLESELFGHERGAFTGAIEQRKGRFELATGGTVFLDEVGELSPSIQVKLLRVLQDKEFERVGGTETLRANARVVAATNRNLEEAMRDGTFREDLYYRLSVFPIHVPPLRERKADVLLLADHFLEKYAKENHKDIRRICTPAIDMLMSYHWPGNVRELENCIERAVLLSGDHVIHAHHLPPSLQTDDATDTVQQGSLELMIDNYEKEILIEALKRTRGNQSRAAMLLGTTPRIVGYKIKKHAIEPTRFRT